MKASTAIQPQVPNHPSLCPSHSLIRRQSAFCQPFSLEALVSFLTTLTSPQLKRYLPFFLAFVRRPACVKHYNPQFVQEALVEGWNHQHPNGNPEVPLFACLRTTMAPKTLIHVLENRWQMASVKIGRCLCVTFLQAKSLPGSRPSGQPQTTTPQCPPGGPASGSSSTITLGARPRRANRSRPGDGGLGGDQCRLNPSNAGFRRWSQS
ncbi:hypothetical protein BGX38DRAFT_1333478 [Terfezia claveryi]|nr:hypothetical protein BGX38DRAFT_1333478 [Terfezia claveryi]